jgi:lipoate-protein ligase A
MLHGRISGIHSTRRRPYTDNKWHSFYEGPFEVIRRNTGGAYILKDRANEILPFWFPPSHLKLVALSQELMEKSYPIKKIITHAAIENKPGKYDYYVMFDITDSTTVWISSDMFHKNISVELYWRNISKRI